MEESIQASISKSRTMMMGIAIICVMLFHEPMWMGKSWFTIPVIAEYGDWGVDVFFFVSGFGLWYALSSNPSCRLFYRKRLLRLLPACIIAGWVLYFARHHGDLLPSVCRDRRGFLLALFGLDLWYIRSILIFYLFTPLFFRVVKRWGTVGFVLLAFVSACIYLIISGIDFNGFYKTMLMWTFSRLPIFLAGLYTASRKSTFKSSLSILPVAAAGVYILIMLRVWGPEVLVYGDTYCLYRFLPTALLVPAMCLLARGCRFVQRHAVSLVRRSVEWLGMHSLELYVCHEGVFYFIHKAYPGSLAAHVWAFAISFLCAWALKVGCSQITERFHLTANA